jgi:hypothetical protein
MSILYKMERVGMNYIWGSGIDKRHKAILEYCIVLMLIFNNKNIPKECLDIREFFRNSLGYNITKYDIESFDEFMGLNGELMQLTHMGMQLRRRHRGTVGLSTLPPYDDSTPIDTLDEIKDNRINYRLVTNYEGRPVYFATYSRNNCNFEKFMSKIFEIKKRHNMRRLYCFGDTNQLWTNEPNVITEIRYNDMPWSLEQRVAEIYRRRHLHMAYYEHQNYEFTVQDPTFVFGRRMVIFNQPELLIERRQYRAQKILRLSEAIKAVNSDFREKRAFNPKLMFQELRKRVGTDELQRLASFAMVSFHDEYGLYMVVDKQALKIGAVTDKLCVTSTTTINQFLDTRELAFVSRNFIKNRIYFETDFWKKYKLLTELGLRRKVGINTILLFSAYLRYYMLYMIY